jgi:hypothetical protein
MGKDILKRENEKDEGRQRKDEMLIVSKWVPSTGTGTILEHKEKERNAGGQELNVILSPPLQ